MLLSAEKLRATLEATEIPFQNTTIAITASFGVATYHPGESAIHEPV